MGLGVGKKGDEPGGGKELGWDLLLLEMGVQVGKVDLDQAVQDVEILLELQVEDWLEMELVHELD